jgi:hypothetical protein
MKCIHYITEGIISQLFATDMLIENFMYNSKSEKEEIKEVEE